MGAHNDVDKKAEEYEREMTTHLIKLTKSSVTIFRTHVYPRLC